MFAQLADAILPTKVSHRLWLHRHDSFAAKQPSRWIDHAQQFTLKHFRSFMSPDGICRYQYGPYLIGEIHYNTDGKPIHNTLSDFFNALRMVVTAYERIIILSDLKRQQSTESAHSIIVLQPIELKMLKKHPDYQALILNNKRDSRQTITLVETGNHVYRIMVTKK